MKMLRRLLRIARRRRDYRLRHAAEEVIVAHVKMGELLDGAGPRDPRIAVTARELDLAISEMYRILRDDQ